MKILMTGASSFTGSWFARELAAGGHDVTVTFTGPPAVYEGLRRQRVDVCANAGCACVFEAPFGGEAFMALCDAGFDVLCQHGAFVTNYKSDDFDCVAALADNTRNLRAVLSAMTERGLTRVVYTGSVFEAGEGAGNNPMRAFSPYGLSKTLTAEVFRYWCDRYGVALGKFVIPNPFGPLEEPRFTHYLMRTWAAGETASVKTPAYVRDNIHVSLLAKLYARFVVDQTQAAHPSGYIETQGAFAERFATAMRERLGLSCGLRLETQTEFPEPKVRINTDVPELRLVDWDERLAWDGVAAYYKELLSL